MGEDKYRDEVAIISTPSRSQRYNDDHMVALEVEVPETLHQIGTDSWFQVGVVLSTGINSAYALGYAGTIMVPLGWTGGVIGLVLSTVISLYASTLIAKIHEYGGKRHIRYRDLAGFMYGRTAYVIVWASQYANLFLINIGFIILGGQALKAFYHLFRDDDHMKLAYFIAIAGLACVLFAIAVPTLSSLRIWLVISSVFSLIYLTIAFALALKDGINAPPRDYSIPGSKINRVFTTAGAAANIVFVFNTGMIPEIQPVTFQLWRVDLVESLGKLKTICRPSVPLVDSLTSEVLTNIFSLSLVVFMRLGMWTNVDQITHLVLDIKFVRSSKLKTKATVRAPVVDNMLKALYFQFTLGAVPVHAVTYVGYWAYGSGSSSYLLNNVSGPVWVKALANISAFLQAIIALHIFASPTYEFLDTKYGIKGSAVAARNLAFRTLVRGGYLMATTFLSALLPFLGDFMSLTGAISSIPLTFILPNHMYLIAMKKQLSSLQRSWHLLNVVLFSVISAAALVAAFRLIAVDSKTYNAFADL